MKTETIIKLLPANLIVLQVPEDAKEFSVLTEWLFYHISDKPLPCSLEIPKGNYQIIGTITKDLIFSFDCEKYVESKPFPKFNGLGP